MRQERAVHLGLMEVLNLIYPGLKEKISGLPEAKDINVTVTGDNIGGMSVTFHWLDTNKAQHSCGGDCKCHSKTGDAELSTETIAQLKLEFCVELLRDADWRNNGDLFIKNEDDTGYIGPYNNLLHLHGYLVERISQKWKIKDQEELLQARILVCKAINTMIQTSPKYSVFKSHDVEVLAGLK